MTLMANAVVIPLVPAKAGTQNHGSQNPGK